MKANILIVDDEEMIRELLCATLTGEGYCCFQAGNADDGQIILHNERIDIALLDITMPGRTGIELLQEIKKVLPDSGVLMITGLTDIDTALTCMHLGADDYIVKPFNIDRIIITVKNSLEKQRLIKENREYRTHLELRVEEQTNEIRSAMMEVSQAYEHTLTALVRALDAREKETGSHSERVMAYTTLLAKTMGVCERDVSIMAKGALLHDIGKIGISDNILLKPGKLTDEEWLEVKKHPQVGCDILSGISYFSEAAAFVLAHHERYDGNGYPHGLRGEQIPLSARIFTLVDTLDAMTSDRPYRKALSYEAVLTEVAKCEGSQFDPSIVKIFMEIPRHRWSEAAGKEI
ncbi:MAG: HD domain-containing phosphohydrolase [Geobacteraceae bacterium]